MEKISWKSNSFLMIIFSLNKLLKLYMLTIVVRSVFEEDATVWKNLYFRKNWY